MTAISETRLLELGEAYGGDIARWPAPERAAAEALLAASPALRARLRPALDLDQWLAAAPAPPAPSPGLRRRVLEAMPAPRPRLLDTLRTMWAELGGVRRAGPVMAAAIALGVALAPLGVAPGDGPQDDGEMMLQIAFAGDDYEEWLR